ncbi:MAG: hypothetical protein JXA89_27410 [Anaerolineae bacterium]|nr:hypothetical protein [Anaerolineae bacterium]
MNEQIEHSGRDETLTTSLLTGMDNTITVPRIFFTRFNYTIRRRSLLDDVSDAFGSRLDQDLSPEHRALLARNEEQLPGDLALAAQMQDVQRDALAP